MEFILESQINKVTVFKHQARIRRADPVTLEPGENLIRFPDLPRKLIKDSLRVGGEGSGIKLKDVEVITTYLSDYQEDTIRVLRDELEELEVTHFKNEDAKAVREASLKSLDELSESGMKTFARGLAFGKSNMDELKEFTAYIDQKNLMLNEELRSLEKQVEKSSRDVEALRKKLKDAYASREKQRFEALVRLEAGGNVEASLWVEYLVPNASWKPQYDVRLEDGNLEIAYQASIGQMTGEDWEDVTLTLSTASAPVFATIPELNPWYITIFKPRPPRAKMAAGAMKRKENAEMAAMPLAAAAEIPEADFYEAEIEESGHAVVFNIPYPVTLPSVKEPHKITIIKEKLEADISFSSFPSLTDQVLVKAEAVNTAGVTFLPGKAALFNGSDYVGPGYMELAVAGEKMTFVVGADDRIRVERELIKKGIVKTRIGTLRMEETSYRITLTNLRKEESKIELFDQIPVSRNAEITVKLSKTLPHPTEVSELNIMKWEIELEPESEKSIEYTFTVEYPKDVRISGLNR